MSDDLTSQDAASNSEHFIDSIVDEFVEQALANVKPDIEGACERYPEYADRIQQAAASLQLLVDQHSSLDGDIDSESLRSELVGELSRDHLKQLDPTMESETSGATETVRISDGKYRIREKLGEGGFGVVYVAEQREPVRRKVAVKVVKPGMDSKEVLARFDAERQALAMMDHPNVAQVLDGGATEDGRPYFVMELIRGIPITKFCDLQKLGLNQRLEIFRDVCYAVQHAHMKGIIHRDIKPSNVLVTMRDDQPVAKVIDFGVAKALHSQLSDSTIYTAFGQIVGTPLYMSPEQIQLNELDVDTRSDIYSLGVLLYELITGDTPFARQSLVENGIQAFREMVCETEPPRPSHRVSTLQASEDPSVIDKRRYDGRELKRLSGELDWIVMKSLEKDRRKRYQSANDFAKDVECLLNGDEVQAKPPTLMYRASKIVKRNKPLFATIGAVMIALTLGMLTTLSQMRRAGNAEQKALRALGESNQQRKIAEERMEFAEQAVDDMYTQFAEKWISKEEGLSDVQREFLEKALAIYRQLADSSDGSRSNASVKKALRRVAAINAALGNDEAAIAARREVVALAKADWLNAPDDTASRVQYSIDCRGLATTFSRVGDSAKRMEFVDQAISAVRGVDPKVLGDFSLRKAFAENAAGLAQLLALDVSTADQCKQFAAMAVESAEQLYAEFPDDERAQRLAARSFAAQAYFFLKWGNREQQALELYDKAISIYENLIDAQRATKQDLRQLSIDLTNKGTALLRLSPDRSIATISERIVEVEREAVKRYPDDIGVFFRLADGLARAAIIATADGDLQRARAYSLEGKSIAEDLVSRFPQRTLSWQHLVKSNWGLGEAAVEGNNPKEAADHFHEMYLAASRAREYHPLASQFYQRSTIAVLLECQACLQMDDIARLRESAITAEKSLSQPITTDDGVVDIQSIAEFNDILNYYEVFREFIAAMIDKLERADEIDAKLIDELGAMDERVTKIFQRRVQEWAKFVVDLPDQRALLRDKSFINSPEPRFYFDDQPALGIGDFCAARARKRSIEGLISYLLESGEEWKFWPELLFAATSFEWTADKKILKEASSLLNKQDTKHKQALAWCLFRLGQFEECSAMLEDDSLLQSEENCFIRAMTAWQLEDESTALDELGRGNDWLKKNQAELRDRSSIAPLKHVPDVAILERLAYEADALINPGLLGLLYDYLNE